MKKKKVSKYSKRRLLIFGSFSIIMIVYFFMTLSIYGIKIYNLKVEEKNLKSELNDMEAKENNLKNEIEKLKDDEYLAKYARENFQYSKEGELVFQLKEDDEETKKQIEKINIDTNYILIGGTTVIAIVILYTLKKHR